MRRRTPAPEPASSDKPSRRARGAAASALAELELLQGLSRLIAGATDLDRALRVTLAKVCVVTGWPYGEVWRPTADGRALERSPLHHGRSEGLAQFAEASVGLRFRRGEGVPGRAWQRGAPVWVPDIQDDPSLPRHDLARAAGIRSAVAIPVMADGEVVTVLAFYQFVAGAEDARFVQLVGSVAAQLGTLVRLKQAEAQLAREREFLAAVLENLSDGVVACDAAGRLTVANRAIRRLNPPLDGRAPLSRWPRGHNLLHADGVTPMRPHETPIARALRGEEVRDVAAVIAPPGLAPRTVLATGQRIEDASGEALGAVVAFHDVTDRRRAEAAALAAREEAESANRAKSDFLARMSHELRTPLNSVIGFAGILLKNKGGSLSGQEISFLQRIHGNGTHLLELINEILDLSKIEAGKMRLDVRFVPVAPLLRSVAAQFEGAVADRPVALHLELPGTPVEVTADPVRLQQILVNLVGNAVKFTPEGSVTVRLVDEPGARRIVVEDTGIGIAPDRLPAIFEPFEQAECSTTRQYGGTGLGLAICRSLCDIMGFRLSVESRLGAGSTFTVELDAA